MNPAIATALVFAALTALEIGFHGAALAGRIDYPLTTFDQVHSSVSIVLGVATSIGLLLRHRFGWWAGVASIALPLVGSVVYTALDRETEAAASFAVLGFIVLIDAALLALLDRPRLRASLHPQPRARLPFLACAQLGVLLLGLGLALSVVWGWFILIAWGVLFTLQRRRTNRRERAERRSVGWREEA